MSGEILTGIPVVRLTGGLVRKTAEDIDTQAMFVYWHIDWLANEEPAVCAVCDNEVTEGWHCLDGGEVYCTDHVVVLPETVELDYEPGHNVRKQDTDPVSTESCLQL